MTRDTRPILASANPRYEPPPSHADVAFACPFRVDLGDWLLACNFASLRKPIAQHHWRRYGTEHHSTSGIDLSRNPHASTSKSLPRSPVRLSTPGAIVQARRPSKTFTDLGPVEPSSAGQTTSFDRVCQYKINATHVKRGVPTGLAFVQMLVSSARGSAPVPAPAVQD